MTPEGKVKAKVNKLLKQFSPIRVEMPVQSGFGKKTLDYLVCYRGEFIVIETKAEGKNPTKLQVQNMREYVDAGAYVFVIRGVDDPTFVALDQCLSRLSLRSQNGGFVFGDRLLDPEVIA